jgi:hypothetical protein
MSRTNTRTAQSSTGPDGWTRCALALRQVETFNAHGAAVDAAAISIQRASDAMHAAIRCQPDPVSPIERGRMDDDNAPAIAEGFEPAIQQAIDQLNHAHEQLFKVAGPALSACMTAITDERHLMEQAHTFSGAAHLGRTSVAELAGEDWKRAILARASGLLAVAVTQGMASVSFEARLAGKPLGLVASLLPSWELDEDADQSQHNQGLPVRQADGGSDFGAAELVIFLARTGEIVCRSEPVQSLGFRVSMASAMLTLPPAWHQDEFAGVAAWCWGAVVTGLQVGQVQAQVSLPVSGDDEDTRRVDLVCRLAVDPVSLCIFVTVAHATTGALIGCTRAVAFDELRGDQFTGWGLSVGCIDPMG